MKFMKRKRLNFNKICHFSFKRKKQRTRITVSSEESTPSASLEERDDPNVESSKDASELNGLPANIFAFPEDVSMMSMDSSASNKKTAKVTVHNSLVLNYTAPLLPPLASGGDTVTYESFHSQIPSSEQKSEEKMVPSFLAHSRMFRRLSQWAFEQVDTGESGTVNKKEVYAGLLLIHYKLASYAGFVFCKVSLPYADIILHEMSLALVSGFIMSVNLFFL